VEDNTIKGGFGSAVLEFASENNYKTNIKTLGIPDAFVEHGKVSELQNILGLDAVSLASFITSFL
jgi:1-deoxy-D-xylulose-5-phosphate synthase